jgi:hypothetical protein
MQTFYTTGVMLGETKKKNPLTESTAHLMHEVRQFLDTRIQIALFDGVYCALNPLRMRRICVT